MRTSKLLGVVATPFLALALGMGIGNATMSDHSSGTSQHGKNGNETTQEAKSKSTTEQANVNEASAEHGKDGKDGKGSRHGKDGKGSHDAKASQENDASTKSKATNDNETKQKLGQDQEVKTYNFYGSHDRRGDHGCGCDDKGHSSDPKGYGEGSASGSVSQKGSNWNSTDQKSKSSAETKQANVFAPYGHGGSGDVDQSNKASTKSRASNENGTHQSVKQHQSVSSNSHGKGHKGSSSSGDVSQKGFNKNETTQDAKSHASTEQVNIYAPITVFSHGYRGGDVTQSNDAKTKSSASNSNYTKQSLDQDQKVKGSGHTNVSQEGHNSNSTGQSSYSSAKTQQVNIYAPITVYSDGGSGGDVHQGNTADTHSSASNGNGTGQHAGQGQASGAAHQG